MRKIYKVEEEFVNSRLDRWFRRKICPVPQSLIEKSIRIGKIKVNNKKRKSSHKLQLFDSISLYDLNFSEKKNIKKKYIYRASKKDLKESSNIIIENNENFVVINKPAGISVQKGTKSMRNIIDILRKRSEFQDCTPFPVHRIDKETTGILLVAKNRKYAQLLTSLFRIRKIHKTYLCIALGYPQDKKGTFRDILFYFEGDKKIETTAVTHYRILDSNNNYSLLSMSPETGRKHQLRKQLLIHGHPVLGDNKYRMFEKKRTPKKSLMLHSYKINFSINETKYSFKVDPPNDFLKTLKEKNLKIYQ